MLQRFASRAALAIAVIAPTVFGPAGNALAAPVSITVSGQIMALAFQFGAPTTLGATPLAVANGGLFAVGQAYSTTFVYDADAATSTIPHPWNPGGGSIYDGTVLSMTGTVASGGGPYGFSVLNGGTGSVVNFDGGGNDVHGFGALVPTDSSDYVAAQVNGLMATGASLNWLFGSFLTTTALLPSPFANAGPGFGLKAMVWGFDTPANTGDNFFDYTMFGSVDSQVVAPVPEAPGLAVLALGLLALFASRRPFARITGSGMSRTP